MGGGGYGHFAHAYTIAPPSFTEVLGGVSVSADPDSVDGVTTNGAPTLRGAPLVSSRDTVSPAPTSMEVAAPFKATAPANLTLAPPIVEGSLPSETQVIDSGVPDDPVLAWAKPAASVKQFTPTGADDRPVKANVCILVSEQSRFQAISYQSSVASLFSSEGDVSCPHRRLFLWTASIAARVCPLSPPPCHRLGSTQPAEVSQASQESFHLGLAQGIITRPTSRNGLSVHWLPRSLSSFLSSVFSISLFVLNI